LLFGLGNPGRKYEATRHNVGFRLADELSVCCRIPLHDGSRRAVYGRGRWKGKDLVIAKPTTYMNRSGWAVAELLDRFKVPPESALVVCDDVNLPLGELRLRPGGSSGGHKGLQSIIECLGTEDFPRLRLGVGSAPPGDALEDYVLDAFEAEEEAAVEGLLERARDTVLCLMQETIEVAMSQFNRRLESRGNKAQTGSA